MTENLQDLPAGSTIILATTSPDKRFEYENIFKRFDLNFIFLDDLGLSPQKTDEMTNTYNGNLIQKACELSLALHENMDAIKDRLASVGFDVSKPIVGMVEDSGIAIYPKDKKKREIFKKKFKETIEHRIHSEFEENPTLRERTFPNMSDDEIDNQLYNVFQNNHWMTEIREGRPLPGPNFKPIFEALKGGMRQIFDALYEALEAVDPSQENEEKVPELRKIRFLNHCSMMLVEPHADPVKHLTAMDIVTGENKGWVKSHEEMEQLFEARLNPENPALQAGEFFTGDMLIPDGQKDTSNLSQQDLITAGMLWTKNNKRANYYRLAAVSELKEKYNLPIAPRYKYTERVNNPSPPEVMVLHGGKDQPRLAAEFEKKLAAENFTTLKMPTMQELLEDPDARLMSAADVVFVMPGEQASDMENAQLLLGATVDKQVMPSAKEKTIVVLNPRGKGNKGLFDGALKMLRHAKMGGLKNGLSEVNHVVEYDPKNYAGPEGAERLYGKVTEILKKESERKKHRLTGVTPIQPSKDVAPKEIPSLETERFTVFVAGGAANEYPEFKMPANQLGRLIHDEGWALVTGAGQKEGPMGAVHSGFVEAYMGEVLKPRRGGKQSGLKPKQLDKIKEIIDYKIIDGITQQQLKGDAATNYFDDVMQAIFENPNAEYLAHQAPDILLRLLQPQKDSKIYEMIGSLKESGRMQGYSMPPLLISEGSGKWPPGMQGHNAGNMQRRMHEMLQSAAHVYIAGGQGTYQELVESARLAIEQNKARKAEGLEPKPICILDQKAYKDGIYEEQGTVFRPVLEAIDRDLGEMGLTREDIGLKSFTNMREIENHLKDYAGQHWNAQKEAKLRA